jgi:methylmalonyl-CoA mutase
MNNLKDNKLFNEFETTSKSEWVKKVEADLKGQPFEKKTIWNNINGFDVESYLSHEDMISKNRSSFKSDSKEIKSFRRFVCNSNDKEINGEIIKAFDQGVRGAIIEINENSSAYDLLEDVDLSRMNLVFVLKTRKLSFIKDFLSFVNESGIEKSQVKGHFDLEVITKFVSTGIVDCELLDNLKEITELSTDFPNFKTISINGRTFQEAGSNQAQEVAYTLNAMVYLIEKMKLKGLSEEEIFNKLHFDLSIGSDYFVEIAKFRAFKIIFNEIAEAYQIVEPSYSVMAKTSIWNKTVTDVENNILRSTSEAMSAILGGVKNIEIDAFDASVNKESDFSKRIANNIVNLLLDESYFTKVNNPVDGSYYIEELTEKISNKALELFKVVEEFGGFLTTFQKERIQKSISEIRFEKLKRLSKRKDILVGVNKYPNLMEKVNRKKLSKKERTARSIEKEIEARRATLEFESLRRKVLKMNKKSEQDLFASILLFGSKSMSLARSSFAKDFVGVAGFQSQDVKLNNVDISESIKSLQDASILILCSSDEDYTNDAKNLITSLRKQFKNKVIILAGSPQDDREELEEAGLDFYINLKSDILDTSSLIIKKLNRD